MTLVSVRAQSRVAASLVVQQGLECHFLRKAIHLVGSIGSGPVNRSLEFIHAFGRELEFAMTRLAILQFSEIFRVDCEFLKIRELGRRTELLNCEIAWKFA